jgi:hypothetical protein
LGALLLLPRACCDNDARWRDIGTQAAVASLLSRTPFAAPFFSSLGTGVKSALAFEAVHSMTVVRAVDAMLRARSNDTFHSAMRFGCGICADARLPAQLTALMSRVGVAGLLAALPTSRALFQPLWCARALGASLQKSSCIAAHNASVRICAHIASARASGARTT